MVYNKFGKNDFNVSLIGFGAGQIGEASLNEKDTELILNEAFDLGITLFDTARAYGLSEERIGKYLKPYRKDIILSTKVGYGVEGIEDWTYDCIVMGVNRALNLLQTDYLDIVHLHSCPLNVLQREDILSALRDVKESGKIRAAAYSGENEELMFAVSCGAFDSVQTSMNIFDQRSIRDYTPVAVENGLGIIAKRPLGNCPWKYEERPFGNYAEDYWLRKNDLGLDYGDNWNEISIRYSAFSSGAHSIIMGTQNINHLKSNISYLEKGRLDESFEDEIKFKYDNVGRDWRGLV